MPSIKKSAAAPRCLLRSLNLFGLDHLDPVILAALTDERPLLLIGPHGTAKSELLNRLATVLQLEHRHYNASLIAFDDLLGYPVPNATRDGLTYLRTSGDLWQAESVFLDEISRCRPETQNKLFAIVHEKRVQGLPLTHLRYRWAAMNPPATADIADDEDIYEGSLPLDPALADRFPWVVPLPVLAEMMRDDRLGLIGGGDVLPDPLPDVRGLLAKTREILSELPATYRDWCGLYVDALIPSLLQARFGISGRRAVHLARGILCVHAACQALNLNTGLTDAAYLTLRYGLPQRAQGRNLAEPQLKALHREALKAVGMPVDSPWHQLRAIADPVKRVAAALSHYPKALNRNEISSLVSDAYASLGKPRQYLFSRHLLPIASRSGCLNVPTFELISTPALQVRALVAGGQQSITMARTQVAGWDALIAAINKVRRRDPTADELGNILLTLHVVEHEHFEPAELIEVDQTWRALFEPLQPEQALEVAA